MSPALKQTYMVIDEWWKKYGYAPTIDEIMFITGERGRGNVSRKIQMLIKLGVCKGIPGRSRTVRPSYIRVHTIE